MIIKTKTINLNEIMEYELDSIRFPTEEETDLVNSINVLSCGCRIQFYFVKEGGSFDEDEDYGKYYTDGIPYDDVAEIVPIIKVKGKLKKGNWYLVETKRGSIPFYAINDEELLCVGRINYIQEPEFGEEFDDLVDKLLNNFKNDILF